MEGEAKERWYQLCQLASVEQDPVKLLTLTQEINQLLEEREERINQKRRGTGVPSKPRFSTAWTVSDMSYRFGIIARNFRDTRRPNPRPMRQGRGRREG